jgi:hypothetical protein
VAKRTGTSKEICKTKGNTDARGHRTKLTNRPASVDKKTGSSKGIRNREEISNRWAQPTPRAGATLGIAVRPSLPGLKAIRVTRSERLKALLFARPASDTSQKQILPHLPYFHLESGDHFDFLCVGYSEAIGNEPVVVTVNGRAWSFSDETFIALKDQLQKQTSWKYSGGADLILCNEITDAGRTTLDTRTALCLNIDKLLKNATILSFESFFQGVIDFAKAAQGENPTWKLSDKHGLRLALEALKSTVIDFLPKGVQKQVSDAFDFCVRDISPRRK